MKKFQLTFGNYHYDKLMKPVREQKECISLILEILTILLIGEEAGSQKGTITIITDKMSRVFCFSDNKYFSMVFPFDVEKNEEEGEGYRIGDSILNMEVDNRLIALMQRMLEQIDFVGCTIDEVIEKAYFDVAEEEYTESEVSDCFNLILRLLTMELGYIRYDYDPENNKKKKEQEGEERGEKIHPLYHLDVNYSSKGTYKLGLGQKMKEEEFVDLLNVKAECRYIT